MIRPTFLTLCAISFVPTSTGGNTRLGGVSKMAQADIRKLLIVGAMSRIRSIIRRCVLPDKTGSEACWGVSLVWSRPSADFIRASSYAVLREQLEHMDAPQRCSSLHKIFCTTGTVQKWLEHHFTATRVQVSPQHQVTTIGRIRAWVQ